MTARAVIVKGAGGGGLGDRIRAILVGALYAELSGRALTVDWADGVYAEKGCNAFDRMFSLRNLERPGQIAASATTRPAAWQDRLDRSMNEVWNEDGNTVWNRDDAIRRYSFDLGQLDHKESILVMWEFDQLPRLRRFLPSELGMLTDESLLSHACRKYLQVKQEWADEIRRRFSAKQPTIGVHVRAAIEAGAQTGLIPLTQYYRAIEHVLKQLECASIFIATDNKAVEETLLGRYPNAWSQEKWFGIPGDPLHLNRDCPDPSRLGIEALLDLLGLAACDHLISLRDSSFSMMARIMSQAPTENRVSLASETSLTGKLRSAAGKLFQ